MSVRSPKKSSSSVFAPNVESSTPMRDSLSMPGMSWQPAQPYLRTELLAGRDCFGRRASVAQSLRRRRLLGAERQQVGRDGARLVVA